MDQGASQTPAYRDTDVPSRTQQHKQHQVLDVVQQQQVRRASSDALIIQKEAFCGFLQSPPISRQVLAVGSCGSVQPKVVVALHFCCPCESIQGSSAPLCVAPGPAEHVSVESASCALQQLYVDATMQKGLFPSASSCSNALEGVLPELLQDQPLMASSLCCLPAGREFCCGSGVTSCWWRCRASLRRQHTTQPGRRSTEQCSTGGWVAAAVQLQDICISCSMYMLPPARTVNPNTLHRLAPGVLLACEMSTAGPVHKVDHQQCCALGTS